MKYTKILGVVAVAAVAAMAFAATAAATSVTSPAGTTYTGNLVAEAQGGGIVTHSSAYTFTCQTSVAEGSVQQHGASVTASGEIKSWNLSNCNVDLTVKKRGSLEIHATESGNATVTSSGMEIESTNTSMGISCIFTTNNTDIGLLTGSKTQNATVDISAQVPRTGGSFFCGSTGELTGKYTITSPSTLYAD